MEANRDATCGDRPEEQHDEQVAPADESAPCDGDRDNDREKRNDDEDRERAAARLEKNGLSRATHYGFSDSFVEKLYYEADKSWRGELPFTVLISTNASRVNVTGALDDPHFVAWLNQLNGVKK
jgi:predicted  nucleic acid-binding Zn-ribbon protein